MGDPGPDFALHLHSPMAFCSVGSRQAFMNATRIFYRVLGLSVVAVAIEVGAATLNRPVIEVVDTNPDPRVFEAELSADAQDVAIDDTVVHALIYKDVNNPGAYAGIPDGLPLPQIVVTAGDEVAVKFTNNLAGDCAALACSSSIHWHGLELDNDSDGTTVTQNRLLEGESYTYRFLAPRPGIFWFHPHMLPGPQTFAGMYGAFVVRDPSEASLQGSARIPSATNTHTLVLSDVEFDAEGDLGYLLDGEVDAVPWATLKTLCEERRHSACRAIEDGETVLVNGQMPTSSTPRITAGSGAGIRLRLVNASTNRYFRLSVLGNGLDNNLYRIGGEGGFLEQVRLEGGTLGSWDTKFDQGEIVLGPAARADVVLVPKGDDGDVVTITGLGYERGGPSDGNPAGDLLYIEIDSGLAEAPFSIAAGNDVLGTGSVLDLKTETITDFLLDPVPFLPGKPGSGSGSADERITLNALDAGLLAIDGIPGRFGDDGADHALVPFQDTSRYARTGDTLELTVTNDTRL
ncbi:MAG: multicopper oxidase family protein, partial [Myxococcota bacterium]